MKHDLLCEKGVLITQILLAMLPFAYYTFNQRTGVKRIEYNYMQAKRPSPKETIATQLKWTIQLATHVWLTHCQGAMGGLMDKWHLWGNYMKAHSVWLGVVEEASELPTSSALNEAVPGIVRQLVFVAPHISSIFISSFFMSPLYSLLALCMNSISNSATLSLRVSGLTLLGTNVMPPTPSTL